MECAWVQDTDSEHVQQAHELVEQLLNQNPCSEAARTEFSSAQALESEEDRAVAMQRAMSILTSDTCEPTDLVTDAVAEPQAGECEELEEQAMTGVEDMVESTEGPSSFAETNEQYAIERFLRFLVVLAVFVLLVVLCTWVVVWIALFIVQYFTMLLGMIGIYSSIGIALWERLILPPALLACGYDLFFRILNPEIHALPHHW
jgi:hypothetical protein